MSTSGAIDSDVVEEQKHKAACLRCPKKRNVVCLQARYGLVETLCFAVCFNRMEGSRNEYMEQDLVLYSKELADSSAPRLDLSADGVSASSQPSSWRQ